MDREIDFLRLESDKIDLFFLLMKSPNFREEESSCISQSIKLSLFEISDKSSEDTEKMFFIIFLSEKISDFL